MIPDELLDKLEGHAKGYSIRCALIEAYQIGKADGLNEAFRDITGKDLRAPEREFTVVSHWDDVYHEDYEFEE